VADLSALKQAKNDLIRKALDAALCIAPIATAIPAALTSGASADLTALPTDWKGLGMVTKDDAYTWSRAVESTDTTSHGELEPTRTDINSDISSLAFTAQETNKRTLELFNNVDLTALTPTAVTGEVAFNNPPRPVTRYYRVMAVAQDGEGSDTIYIAKILPRAMVSEPGDQVWSDQNEITYPMTLTAKKDSTLGYSVRHIFGGPGWKSRLVAMGFPAAA